MATAILDRLPYRSHVPAIHGNSYRLREKRRSGLLKATTAPAPAGASRWQGVAGFSVAALDGFPVLLDRMATSAG